MELIYSVIRKVTSARDVSKDEDILCRLSSKNIVAFSTSVALERTEDSSEASHRVYVSDINTPWDYYAVDSFTDKVTALEWHPGSYSLLILTDQGRAHIYTMKDFSVNSWECAYTAEVEGERFITASWFAQPHRLVLNGDKRDVVSYTEKLSRERCVPPLQQYGGRAVDGWVAVTASSMVVVGIPRPNSKHMTVESCCLGPIRSKCTLADIDFNPSNGHILIATSNGQMSSVIATFRIKLTSESDMYSIDVSAMAGFHARTATQADNRGAMQTADMRVSHVRFMSVDSGGKAIIVAIGNSSGSTLELWTQCRHDVTLHHSFNRTDTKLSTDSWVYKSSVIHASMPVSIAIPSFPVQYSNLLDPTGKLFQCVAVAYKDGSMKIVSKPSFQALSTTNLDMGFNDVDRPESLRKLTPCIVSMQQTFTGSGLVGIDQLGCMYLMKVLNTRDLVTQVPPNYLVAMLEYLTMSGHDCWDLLIALKPGIIENVIQRFVDNFSKQANVLQELLFTRHMSMRAALFRASPAAQQRSADCHCRLMLHLISTHFKALLQPKGLSAQAVGPAEKLSLNCSKKIEGDIDNVMMTLNPEKKEFVVEERTLQAIQPLIQWVADLTLYLLTSLPHVQGYGSSLAGSSLLHDATVLCSLREMLVLMRVWTVIHQRPLLHFTTSTSNLDPLLEMFKLLTKVWQLCKEGKGADYDDALLDKCCLLQSQIYTATSTSLLLGNTHYTSSLLLQNHPLKYAYGEVPNHMVTNDSTPSQCVDTVHLTHLGFAPSDPSLRRCVRCDGCTAGATSCTTTTTQDGASSATGGGATPGGSTAGGGTSATTTAAAAPGGASVPALAAWQGKWMRGCLCGGHWKNDTAATRVS